MRDVASGSALLAIAVIYFLGASGLPIGQGEPGPRFFPFLVAAALLGFAITIIVRGARTSPPAIVENWRRSAALVAVTAAYAMSFALLGFVASTLIYCAGVVLIMGQRGWSAVVIPIATTVFLYLSFVVGLGVTLP